MLVRHHIKTQTFPIEQVVRAEELGLRNSLNSQPFERVFLVLVKARMIQELLVIRDEIRLWDFLSSNNLVIVESKLSCFVADALEKLAQFGGIEIYFGLVKDSVKAAEICLSRQRKSSDLRSFKGFVLESCKLLLSSNKLSEFSSDPQVSDLLSYLRETY